MAEPRDEIAVENLKKIGAESYVLAPSEEWTGEDWYKIVLLGEDDELEVIREKLKGIYGGTFGYEKSGRHVIELHRPDRSKASVIDTYRDMFKEQGRALTIYAVGDYENDIEMLKTADVAVCPENALDAVKELCDYILSSNDVGVIADLIEMLERTIV